MTPRLRHLARVNPSTPEFDRLEDDAEVTFIPLEAVWPGDRFDVTRRRPKAEVAVGYTRFREGDILVPKITPTFQADRTVIAHGLDGCVGAGTTELHIVRTGESADARYLRYLLSSKPFLDEGEASMIGVAGQKRVPDDCLRDLRVSVATLDWQRAIANYLDVETARIDALIEKKRRMVEVLEERRTSVIGAIVEGSGPTVAVRFMTSRITSGPRGWSALASDSGTPFLRITNIQRQSIELDMSDTLLVSAPDEAESRRTEVSDGDVLVSITADIGSVAVARRVHAGSHVSQHIALLTPDGCRSDWLAYAIKSPGSRATLDAGQYGGTKTQLGLGDIASLRVPRPSLDDQDRLLETIDREIARIETLGQRLLFQIDLLLEHRQALITAAVTGELSIPGVAA